MPDKPAIAIRPQQIGDAAAITHVYNQGIERRIATFETRLGTPAEIEVWFCDPRNPLLVAEVDGRVGEWISASTYRARECYAGITEFSVYIATE